VILLEGETVLCDGPEVICLFHKVGGMLTARPDLSEVLVALWDLREANLEAGNHPVASCTLLCE